MIIWGVFFILMRRTQSWILSKHCRNNLYIKKSWERGDEDFILIKVGGAKMHKAMFHYYRTCQVFPLRYDCFRHAHPTKKTSLSGNCKKTPIGIQVSVSKVYVTFFLWCCRKNWVLQWLFVVVPRSHTIRHTHTHTHTAGLLRMSDQLVVSTATNSQHKTKKGSIFGI